MVVLPVVLVVLVVVDTPPLSPCHHLEVAVVLVVPVVGHHLQSPCQELPVQTSPDFLRTLLTAKSMERFSDRTSRESPVEKWKSPLFSGE